jgi:hypothetical protein
MKRAISILAITLLLMTGCKENKQSTDELITVDVVASYPEKELILQDFMDVECIPLETNDEFLTQGYVRDIGKEIILVTNRNNDGDIFVFDRETGKGLRKINRKGQGGEEYPSIYGIILDENSNEMFVSTAKKILVYDLYGKFKRSIKFIDGVSYSTNIFSYDKDNLICYDLSDYYKDGEDRGKKSYHVIISKQDGSITRKIQIPFKKINTMVVRIGEGTVASSLFQIIPCHGNWLLVETSSDTVYSYMPNNTISPFIVRTPSIHAMKEPKVFLSMSILTDRYYFLQTIKKEFNFEKMSGFPATNLMYDKQENTLFKYAVYNGDYTDKRQVDMTLRPVNHEIASWQPLETYQLVEAYKKGELKGKLKEIASKLDEEDNPVIMLVKHKK